MHITLCMQCFVANFVISVFLLLLFLAYDCSFFLRSFAVDMARLCITKDITGECLLAWDCVCVYVCYEQVCVSACVLWALCVRDGVRMHQGEHVLALLPIWGKSVAHTSNMTPAKTTWVSHAISERYKHSQRGLFSSTGPSRGKKRRNNRACLKLSVVALLGPKKKEVCPHASAHAIQKVLNPQGDSCHIHLKAPVCYLRTNNFFAIVF